jgi:glutaminase
MRSDDCINSPAYSADDIMGLRDQHATAVSPYLDPAVPRAHTGGHGGVALAGQHFVCGDIVTPMTNTPEFTALAQAAVEIHAQIASRPPSGKNASYIRALESRNPNDFGFSLVTSDGGQVSRGQAHVPFSIQSTSKPLTLALALKEVDRQRVDQTVSSDECSLPFNAPATAAAAFKAGQGVPVEAELKSLKTPESTSELAEQLRKMADSDPKGVRPANAMINMGAVAVAGLIPRKHGNFELGLIAQIATSIEFAKSLGRPATGKEPLVDIDFEVFGSELKDSASNQTLARTNLLLQGHNEGDPKIAKKAFDVVDAYINNCALRTHIAGLTSMYATLANDGMNPFTKCRVLDDRHCATVKAQMDAGGLYEATPSFRGRTGLIAKSGVGGSIVAIDPSSRLTIGVYSSPLDDNGNSARGMEFLHRLANSQEFKRFKDASAIRDLAQSVAHAGHCVQLHAVARL